ncbi:hypothetical protein GJ700_02570 [Duganella sp. FT92W]|uniref:Uncharacterized protein n=1 Tax=Pseudoduganella rivuli TaxID=2666085 RepID=A0A7X2IJ18_9BURK|nr:hypothetical protein [Pseudoduganella rivuli]MRV70603.1 hypothetical protein [Pseudoduganella rivuli]
MQEANMDGIAVLRTECSPQVSAAALEFVDIKNELDRLSRSAAGARIVAQCYPTDYPNQTIAPFDFISTLLPFFKYCRPASTRVRRYKALVPTNMVIGDSWRWRPEHLNETKRAKAIQTTYDAFAASSPEHAKTECPRYFFIVPLGIVAAHEAKNRVALFRELAIPHIPALVSEESYPAADRIRIFSLPDADLAVLDGRFVERVQMLHLSTRLLNAYGISVETHWPEDYPEPARFICELNRPRYHDVTSPIVADMYQLNIDSQAEQFEVRATLMEIEAARLPGWSRWLQLALFILGLAFALEFCKPWPNARTFIAALMGGLLMLFAIPVLPFLQCRIRDLRDPYRATHLFDQKRNLRSNAHVNTAPIEHATRAPARSGKVG